MKNIYYKWVHSLSSRQISFIGHNKTPSRISDLSIIGKRRYSLTHNGSFSYTTALKVNGSLSVIGNMDFIVGRIGK